MSALTTFAATFFTTLGAEIASGALDPTTIGWSVVAAIGMVAIRAGFKAAIEAFTPIHGDPLPPAQQ